jgi:Flp pilus assembly CpaF family ATPase
MATGPMFIANLKYEEHRMMHVLPPIPYDDPTGSLEKFRQNIVNKVLDSTQHNLMSFDSVHS